MSSSARSGCWRAGSALRRAIEEGHPHSMILHGPPGQRQDDAGADHRRGLGRGVRGGERGAGRPGRGAGGDRARPRAPAHDRHDDDLLPRRDPPLQQGPAGRAAAGGRGRAGDADRRDDREPVLRGQLGADLAQPRVRARRACARATCASCSTARWRATSAAPGRDRDGGARVPRRARRAATPARR